MILVFNTLKLAINSSTSTTPPATSSFDFGCGLPIRDSRDSKWYRTVIIGNQCWMAQNLNVGTKIDSNSSTDNQTDDSIIEKYCYGNFMVNCLREGGLYQWNEMMQYSTTQGVQVQGICPIGWHLPTDTEWKTLEMALGMSQAEADVNGSWRGTNQGTKLKEGVTSGFQALLAGIRSTGGSFDGRGAHAFFWSSTESGGTGAWYRGLSSGEARVNRGVSGKAFGFSVRCVKD